jgi:hypothetical protein
MPTDPSAHLGLGKMGVLLVKDTITILSGKMNVGHRLPGLSWFESW